jgi:hypothetical protein
MNPLAPGFAGAAPAKPGAKGDRIEQMKKPFYHMTASERDAVAKTLARGISFDETRPLSKRSQALWDLAKRSPGRPPKPVGEKT